jgi:hypothetical protein
VDQLHFLYSRQLENGLRQSSSRQNLKGNSRSLWVKIDDPTPLTLLPESSRNALQTTVKSSHREKHPITNE